MTLLPAERGVEINHEATPYSAGSYVYGGRRIMNKMGILNQIKLNRTASLLAEAQELDFFRRIIEEVNARNYPRLAALGTEHSLSLGPLYRVLENKAAEVMRHDVMPKSCEIALLELILSSRAEERRLTNLAPPAELDENEVVGLYFLLFTPQFGETEMERLNTLLEELNLRKMRDYIFDRGLQRWFNIRYRMIKAAPEKNLPINQIIEEIGLPVLFDESLVLRHYVAKRMENDTQARDMKEDLYLENSMRAEATEKLHQMYLLFENYPCDFLHFKELLLELSMEEELARIELEGISQLKDYIRAKSVIGAQEVALRYDFVAPATAGDDLVAARKTIAGSFLSQALKSKKGKIFLRAEALYNLNSNLRSGQCFQLPYGYLLALLRTADQADHYLFGRYNSRLEQVTFALGALGAFVCQDSGQKAARGFIRSYMETLAGEIRVGNAVKKTLYALPIILGLAAMVGMVYYFTAGGIAGAIALAAAISAIGVAIAAKNGYDEEVTAASHERIPEYLCRQQGKVIHTALNVEPLPQAETRIE